MTIKRNAIASIVALGALGAMIGLGSSASATALIPGGSGQLFKDFLIPIGTKISVSSFSGGAGDADGEATGVANSSVSAKLIEGSLASSGGYNSSRNFISTCEAKDFAPVNATPTTDSSGCNGAVFHDLFVFD
jgi:hypothetical protein